MTKLSKINPVGKMVTEICESSGYVFVEYQENNGTIIFERGDCKLIIYLTKMTVATVINHPKQGRGQLFRKNVSFDELKKICMNPRLHTGKGYKTKAK